MWGALKVWEKLTRRQQILAGAGFSWIGTKLLDRIFDWGFDSAPHWRPIEMSVEFLRSYVLNGYVGSFLLGMTVIGFWSNIVYFIKKYSIIILPLLLPAFFFIFLSIIEPTMKFLKSRDNAILYDHSKYHDDRSFTDKSPNEIQHIFRDNTSISANKIFKDDFLKWISIKGKVEDIKESDSSEVSLTLKQYDGIITLKFEKSWLDKLSLLKKDSYIYSVCRFESVDYYSIILKDCELDAYNSNQ